MSKNKNTSSCVVFCNGIGRGVVKRNKCDKKAFALCMGVYINGFSISQASEILQNHIQFSNIQIGVEIHAPMRSSSSSSAPGDDGGGGRWIKLRVYPFRVWIHWCPSGLEGAQVAADRRW